MNMLKKKQKKIHQSIVNFLKNWWWVIIGGVVLLCLGVYQLVISNIPQQRFDVTYKQFTRVEELLRENTAVDSQVDTILKTCRNIGPGFTVSIECKVSMSINLISQSRDKMKDLLTNALKEAQFNSIDIGFVNATSNDNGTAVFRSQNNMVCGGYWQTNTEIVLNLYCRESTFSYLSGFGRD